MAGGRIAVILLAAGASQRLGRPKQLIQHPGGRSLLRHAAESATTAGLGPVFVVLGACGTPCESELAGLDVTIVHNGRWAEGMGSSVSAGLAAARATVEPDAVIIMVCDQPAIRPEHLRSLAEHQRQGATVVAAEYQGAVGVPALFSRDRFTDLASLAPHSGGKAILHRMGAAVIRIPAPELSFDLDYQADLLRMRDHD